MLESYITAAIESLTNACNKCTVTVIEIFESISVDGFEHLTIA